MSSPCIRGKDKRNIFWVTFDWEVIQSRDNRVLISLLRSGNHQRVDIQHAGHRNRGVVQSLLHGETMPAVRLPNQVTRHDRWWIRLPTPRKVQDPFNPLLAPPPVNIFPPSSNPIVYYHSEIWLLYQKFINQKQKREHEVIIEKILAK